MLLRATLVAFAAILSLALVASQTAHAQEAEGVCPTFDLADLPLSLETVDVVVLGDLVDVDGTPAIAGEVFLKGSVRAHAVPLADGPAECPQAVLPAAGARVLAAVRQTPDGYLWPIPEALFVLTGGVATNGPAVSLPEDDVISRIRDASGQYAVLATDPSEGVSIDWLRVVLPVVLAAAVILGISLVLLRIWHRIEPE